MKKYVKYRKRRNGPIEVLNSDTLLWVVIAVALEDCPELDYLNLPTDGIDWGNDAPSFARASEVPLVVAPEPTQDKSEASMNTEPDYEDEDF